jgi:amidophosphoribosyltransferase
MVIGFHKETETYIVASESCAFSAVGAQLLGDVQPGELVKMSRSGIERKEFAHDQAHAHCAFEYTYFAHPSSIMEGINVYLARRRIGQYLAKKFPIGNADVVVPVPDSARPAAFGYAQELGLPFEEGLLKNRYSKKGSMRSFIEPYQDTRVEINREIIPVREVVDRKHVVVVDDSIVRGTSSAAIIKTLRYAGATKISLVVTYPPIRYPCYAGIDFPSQDELVAFRGGSDAESDSAVARRVAAHVGADQVVYNDTANLAASIGLEEKELCFTCSTGNYSPLGIKPIFKSRMQMKGE